MRLTLSAHGAVDPALAWLRYLRPELWSTWSPQIRGVEYAGQELHADTTGRVLGPGVAVDFRVTAVDRSARTWAWRVRVPGLGSVISLEHGVLEHGVEATRPGTRTWLRLHGAAPLVIGYAPAAQWALHRLVRP